MRAQGGVPGGGVGDGLVGEEVGAGAARCVVFGGGDEELAGGVEFVGVPAGGEHALAEDEVDVFAFADAEADPHVHLGAERALAHGLLGRPLGGGDEGDGDGPAAAGDRVGVPGGLGSGLHQLGVLINDDDQGGHLGRWLPDALAGGGEVGSAGFEDGHRIRKEGAGFDGGSGQAAEAGGPGAEFHAAFEVDGPDDDVGAGGEVAHRGR